MNLYDLRDVPRPAMPYTFYDTFLDAKETAIYGSARLKVAEPVSLILAPGHLVRRKLFGL